MKTTCIMCPVGCELLIVKNGDEIKVTGNSCIRGERYGKQEMENPTRIVTSLVKTKNGICAVKTTAPVPKDMIFEVLKEIQNLKPNKVKNGQILINNILNLDGINLIVTRDN